MCGSGYVIDYCHAAIEQSRTESIYRNYMADVLRVIAKSIGCRVEKRFYDLTNPTPVETRTAQEIVNDITAKAGLRVVKKIQ